MIRVERVSFEYSGGAEALRDVSIEFAPEHIFAVLGESGSGKTTLLKCLGRFLAPKAGAITFDGQDIYEMPEREFRQTIGIVFQDLYLFPHLTVRENMTLAPTKVLGKSLEQAAEEANAVLQRLGIKELADSYPSQVSGGQAQRAAIARGLVMQPAYLLLDEPTSALDARTSDDFARWLVELKETTNFVIVTHDVLFAREVATRGVYLSSGQVHATGSIEEMIERVQSGPAENA
jgi:ABC-type polar amino acid transport system ATPase subunit